MLEFLEHGLPVVVRILIAVVNSNDTTNASTPRKCAFTPINIAQAELFILIPAVLIPLLLGFFIKRQAACLSCCHGRPGLAVPMNAIDMRHIRFAYLCAFGSTTQTILTIFLSDKPLESVITIYPSWAKNMVRLAAVVIYGTIWYPLFAAITSEKIIGYVFGILVVAMQFTLNLYNDIACSNIFITTEQDIVFYILGSVPLYTSLGLLMIYFIVVIIRQLSGHQQPSAVACARENKLMADYTRNVLRVRNDIAGLKGKLKSLYLTNVSGFIFPPRFVCSLLVAAIVVYTLVIFGYGLIIPIFYEYKNGVKVISIGDTRTVYEVFQTVRAYNVSNPMTFITIYEDSAALVVYVFDVLHICVIVATTLSAIITAIHFPLILYNYRRNVLLAYKGVYTHIIPPSRLTPASAVSGFSRLAGFQAAYISWGFIITWIAILAISLILAFVVCVPIINGFGQFYLNLLKNAWPGALTAAAVVLACSLITRYFFVDRCGAVIAIKNRQVYFIWAYYLLFYDIFIGLLSCLLRVIKSAVIGILFIGRIDTPVISRYFENLDPGYCVYSQYIATEVAHNNPIMRTFLNILIQQGKQCAQKTDHTKVNPTQRRRQVIFQWQLLYTLHNNPDVRKFRKHNIEHFQALLERRRELPYYLGTYKY